MPSKNMPSAKNGIVLETMSITSCSLVYMYPTCFLTMTMTTMIVKDMIFITFTEVIQYLYAIFGLPWPRLLPIRFETANDMPNGILKIKSIIFVNITLAAKALALTQPASKHVNSNAHISHISINNEKEPSFKKLPKFLKLSRLKKCHDSCGTTSFLNHKYPVKIIKFSQKVIDVAMEHPLTPIFK